MAAALVLFEKVDADSSGDVDAAELWAELQSDGVTQWSERDVAAVVACLNHDRRCVSNDVEKAHTLKALCGTHSVLTKTFEAQFSTCDAAVSSADCIDSRAPNSPNRRPGLTLNSARFVAFCSGGLDFDEFCDLLMEVRANIAPHGSRDLRLSFGYVVPRSPLRTISSKGGCQTRRNDLHSSV